MIVLLAVYAKKNQNGRNINNNNTSQDINHLPPSSIHTSFTSLFCCAVQHHQVDTRQPPTSIHDSLISPQPAPTPQPPIQFSFLFRFSHFLFLFYCFFFFSAFSLFLMMCTKQKKEHPSPLVSIFFSFSLRSFLTNLSNIYCLFFPSPSSPQRTLSVRVQPTNTTNTNILF